MFATKLRDNSRCHWLILMVVVWPPPPPQSQAVTTACRMSYIELLSDVLCIRHQGFIAFMRAIPRV